MKQRAEKIQRYLNPVSQLHLTKTAPYNVFIGGRGVSKSFTNGLKQARKVALMPRSVGLFNSPTYQMIYTKTLIPMKAAWEQHCGYIEGIHYVVGKAPPKHFERPYHKPHRYENVVTFWNGRTIVFGSFDRPALISGGSYDDADTDEAYMISWDDYSNFVIPTLRPTHPSFRSCSIHLQQTFTSSMPYKGLGEWLLDFRNKALQQPKMYGFIGWEPLAKVQMGSSWMNVHVLGRETLLQWKAGMNPISYRIMVLNQKVTDFGNTFYPAIGAKHFYTPKANDKVILVPIGGLSYTRDASYDEGPDDYDPDLPLHISHDWGKFNCITIDQQHSKEVRVINSMHTFNGGDDPKDQDDLADQFAEYYRMHRNKIVYQWGDKSGKSTMANSKKTYFEQFADRLRAKNWRVIMKKTGDVEHLERYRFINRMLKEEDPRLPRIRFNNNNCQDLRTALESAQMKDHKKDKSSEQNPDIKPEHATHYTDAFDYRIYHGFKSMENRDQVDAHSTSLDR